MSAIPRRVSLVGIAGDVSVGAVAVDRLEVFGADGEPGDVVVGFQTLGNVPHDVLDKLEDDAFSGGIPGCKGVIAFGNSLRECESELRSILEDWILVGLKLGHRFPVIDREISFCVQSPLQ